MPFAKLGPKEKGRLAALPYRTLDFLCRTFNQLFALSEICRLQRSRGRTSLNRRMCRARKQIGLVAFQFVIMCGGLARSPAARGPLDEDDLLVALGDDGVDLGPLLARPTQGA
ncbi:MAG: hypothetical protein JWM76_361 [Pseudonocardiales bacterium]|nr:hypothetical protein [Pseudonocardiales bacterium]